MLNSYRWVADPSETINKRMQNISNAQDPHPKWSKEGLETVSMCPLCGSNRRNLLHQGLRDRIFSAAGRWSMYQCDSCASAYLDPRPTPESIGFAYEHYITHEKIPNFYSLSFLERLKVRLANGYRNHRYGTRDVPASVLGILAAGLLPKGRAIIDAGMRHLPEGKARGRLLDIGFGNGLFLQRAAKAGWGVVGVDADLKTVDAASKLKLDVRLGGVESLDPSIEKFDVITMAHVIEHVHHPTEVLRACYRLLEKNGFVWIETPNIASIGHRLFDDCWRGLEPPRHLVLFNLMSMTRALHAAGFKKVVCQPYRPLCDFLFNQSQAISEGVDPYSDQTTASPDSISSKKQSELPEGSLPVESSSR
jgi:2-polyprenyl-3-methyl-5-hydroxy-6-metoxy-1,4-benzoquinol methylase